MDSSPIYDTSDGTWHLFAITYIIMYHNKTRCTTSYVICSVLHRAGPPASG